MLNEQNSIEKEVQLYQLTSKSIGLNGNPITWWKEIGRKEFPQLVAKLARKYLAIPATSAASERLAVFTGSTHHQWKKKQS